MKHKKGITWVDGKLRTMAWISPKDPTLYVNDGYEYRLDFFVRDAEKDGFKIEFINMHNETIPFTYDIIEERGDTCEQN